MDESKIISHEIGHGIIAFLFNEKYFVFEGIKLNPNHIFDRSDLAYTVSKPVENIDEKVNQDYHLAAAVDGLLLLGGIVGMTVFQNKNLDKFKIDASLLNFRKYFDLEGSEGDFEIINRGNRPYGWYLFKAAQMTTDQASIMHLRVLNLLKKIFIENVFQECYQKLYVRLKEKNELTIGDFKEIIDQEVVKKKVEEIEEYIKSGLGKPLLVK